MLCWKTDNTLATSPESLIIRSPALTSPILRTHLRDLRKTTEANSIDCTGATRNTFLYKSWPSSICTMLLFKTSWSTVCSICLNTHKALVMITLCFRSVTKHESNRWRCTMPSTTWNRWWAFGFDCSPYSFVMSRKVFSDQHQQCVRMLHRIFSTHSQQSNDMPELLKSFEMLPEITVNEILKEQVHHLHHCQYKARERCDRRRLWPEPASAECRFLKFSVVRRILA